MPHYERRIYFGLVVIVMGFLPILAGSFFSLRTIIDEQNELVSRNARELLLAERLRYENAAQAAAMPAFVLTGDEVLVHDFELDYQKSVQISQHLLETEKDPVAHDLIIKIQDLTQKLYDIAEPGIQMRKAGASAQKVHQYFETTSQPISAEMGVLLNQLVDHETQDFQNAQRDVKSIIRRTITGLIVLSIFSVVFLALTAALIIRSMRQKRAYDLAQAELLEQEQELSIARKETVEVVAHDLKSPLATIQMSVEMMLEQSSQSSEGDEYKEGLLIAKRSAESMSRLIRDLLDHSKIESGRGMILEKKKNDLCALIHDLEARFAPQAQAKKIHLKVEMQRAPLVCLYDAGRIEQVLSNFIGNALKFTSAGGHVVVRASSDREGVSFFVEDDGPGLSEEQASHVFERFWQVRENAKRGTGLGLSISKAIVDAHQGQIWVESQPGHGSKFCVSLPS